MALELPAAIVIRATAGGASILVGLVALAFAARSDRARALLVAIGAHSIGLGSTTLLTSMGLDGVGARWPYFGAAIVQAGGALLLVGATLPARGRARQAIVGLAVAFLLIEIFGFVERADGLASLPGQPAGSLSIALRATATDLTLVAVAALLFRHGAALRLEHALLAIGIALQNAIFVGRAIIGAARDVLGPSGTLLFVVSLAAVLLICVTSLRITRAGNPAALVIALVVPGLLLVGEIASTQSGTLDALIAALRVVAALAIALALLRGEQLGGSARSDATRRRGTLAAVGLATLFIVAQVAQNYFSAEYGLLLGGVVAGAFLFAAAPLQRALEGSPSPRVASSAQMEDAYRYAVRAAIADGVMTREEELHLGEVATRLGLSPTMTARLRHEVEDEQERVKRNP